MRPRRDEERPRTVTELLERQRLMFRVGRSTGRPRYARLEEIRDINRRRKAKRRRRERVSIRARRRNR